MPTERTVIRASHIIAHYGAMSPDGIDAIQLELGRARSTDTLKLARDLGDAIAGFYERYVKKAREVERTPTAK